MACVSVDPGGRRRILFVDANGTRKTIRLGKLDQRAAESICRHVEALLAARLSGQPLPQETAVWLGRLPPKLYDRLARAGLIEPRPAAEAARLGPFIEGYVASRLDLKPSTLTILDQARRRLVEHFGADRRLDSIGPAEADQYRAWLIARGLARNSVHKLLRYAKHYFGAAVERGLIAANPFRRIPCVVGGDPARRVFVPADVVLKLIDSIPDPEWKLMLALARFQGLRIPSEALALTWHDVDFERRRLIVRAAKTGHHKDGGIRVQPLFPETAPLLQAVFDAAPEGAEYVICRWRNPATNLRTQLLRYLTRAGIAPWPKLWQNLRASRATELANAWPSHVCAAWLGHSELIADRHYRIVTDEHLERAANWTEAAQKTAQHLHACTRTEAHGAFGPCSQVGAIQRDTLSCNLVHFVGLGVTGLEPVTSSV